MQNKKDEIKRRDEKSKSEIDSHYKSEYIQSFTKAKSTHFQYCLYKLK